MPSRNLVELHRVQAERLGPRTALRFKRHGLYHDLSWSQYRAEALACAAALADAGVRPGDRVGLFAENRIEWLLADVGVLTAGAVNVTPHAPLTARQVQYELADSGASWLFVSTREQLTKIEQVRAELPAIRGIVTFDPLPPSPPTPLPSGERGERDKTPSRSTPLSRSGGEGDICSWRSFLQRGRSLLAALADELALREADLGPESLATIMYTSGTTGPPKGVMLTHGNLVSNVEAVLAASPTRPDDIRLSWLPYSHIYARTVDHYHSIACGVVLCLAESVDTLLFNLAEIHPTHMNSVPRFYEKVYAYAASDDPAQTTRQLRDCFGPRIDFLCSGGAPLPPPVAKAYNDAGLLVLQGYGLTESSPVISFNTKEHYKLDTVGRPLPGIEVKIAPDGEVLTRGPHVMKGYWKKPEATAEALRDGWLYTGDLGELDADGFLKITGRKKELMVLSSGKKVVPPQLEGLLIADPCIDQAVICGEGRNFLTALVVPNWGNLREALTNEGVSVNGDDEALARDPAVRALLQRRMDEALKDVSSWERVKKFVVLPRPFSVENDEMTVSLKLRRTVIFAHYNKQVEEMYKKD
jgi:long-chain acyl-CoA synthetase